MIELDGVRMSGSVGSSPGGKHARENKKNISYSYKEVIHISATPSYIGAQHSWPRT